MSAIVAGSLLTAGLQAKLAQTIQSMEGRAFWPRLASLVESDKDKETYAWFGQVPAMELILDDASPKFTGVTSATYELTNKLYKAAMQLKRKDLDDDQTGLIDLRIQELARVGVEHLNSLVINLLINGDVSGTGNDYTGQAFFNNTHTARLSSGAGDNIIAGTGVTVAAIKTDIGTAISTSAAFLGENGLPFHTGMSEFTVVAPVALQMQLIEAIRAPLISNTSNILLNQFNIGILTDPRLDADDANDYYVLHTGGAIKPFILQERDGFEFQALDDMEATELAAIHEIYRYINRWRGTAGYAHWQNAVKVTNA